MNEERNIYRRPSSRASHRSSLKDWFQLLRVPNLLTVPGDPVAGALLASAGQGITVERVLLVAMASVGLYGAGLLMNDVVDVEIDKKERPGRPIASGVVSRSMATLLAVALGVIGLVFCMVAGPQAGVVGLCLAAAIMLYNGLLKGVPVLGALTMGACRALNVLLGAVLVTGGLSSRLVIAAALIMLAYIACVTLLAAHETEGEPPSALMWTPATVLVLGMLVFAYLAPLPGQRDMLILIALIVLTSARGFVSALRPQRGRGYRRAGSSTMPIVIGSLISNVMFAQATFAFGSGAGTDGLIVAVALIGLWVANRLLTTKFYAS
ncbi:MAG: UbiA family prenyltransferase [bacterium]